ncbi:MAG: hypothetical protein B7Y42_15340 [Polaromonas sp. 28-63-22]|jgi:hypothetical protein|nr:MAG: hypothetical protein B7Y42_15340 [Polaromonas sp. 28-63-22]
MRKKQAPNSADSSAKTSLIQAGAPETPATSAAGKGVPQKTQREQAPLPGRQTTPHDAAVEASAELPHDRDQSTDMTAATPDPAIHQAAKDLKRGLSDTSKGAEMDKAYRKLGA